MKIDASYYPNWNEDIDTHLYIDTEQPLQTSIAHYTYMQDKCFHENTALTLVPDVSGCLVLQDSGNGLEIMFWGPTTRNVMVHANSNILFRFFVEFKPGGAYTLFHHDQKQYINVLCDLFEVNEALADKIVECYNVSSYLHEFVKGLNDIFLRLQTHEDTFLKEGMYSERHLQRLYNEQIGCGKKQYQKIERINQALKYIQVEQYTMRDIAQMCGYYDESHFLKDFKSVLHVTPKQYIEQMSNFYNESYKF